MSDSNKPPAQGSKQWVKNESIIAKNPELRKIRDIQQGFNPSSGIRTSETSQAYKDGWDRIFGNRDNVNHKDEEDE